MIYILTLATFVLFALIARFDGGAIVIGGQVNETAAESLMDRMKHQIEHGSISGVQHSWNSRFWCAERYPSGWIICCDDVCGGVYAVYRYSFTLCLFFAFLTLCTIGTTKFGALAHRGFWILKAFTLFGLLISTLFLRNEAMEAYREVARYCSFIFLLMQILLLIDFGCAPPPRATRNPSSPHMAALPCWRTARIPAPLRPPQATRSAYRPQPPPDSHPRSRHRCSPPPPHPK